MLLMRTRSCLDGRWCLREDSDMADSTGPVPKKGDKLAITVDDANKGVLLVCLEHCSRLYRGVLLDCTDGLPPARVYRPGSLAVENPRQLPDRSPSDRLASPEDNAYSCCNGTTPAQQQRNCALVAAGNTAVIAPASAVGSPLSCDAAVASALSSLPIGAAGAVVCRRPAKNRFVRNRMLRPRQTMCFKCQSHILDVSNDDISDASNDAGKKRKSAEYCNLSAASHKRLRSSEVSPHIKISFSSPSGQDVVEIASKPLTIASSGGNPSAADDDDGVEFETYSRKKKHKGRHKRKKRADKRRARSEKETCARSCSSKVAVAKSTSASDNETSTSSRAITLASAPAEMRPAEGKPMQGAAHAKVAASEKSTVCVLSERFLSACSHETAPAAAAAVVNAAAESAVHTTKDAASHISSHPPRFVVQNAKLSTAPAVNLSERLTQICGDSSQPSGLAQVSDNVGSALLVAPEQPLITRVRTRNVPMYLHNDGRPIRVGDVVWGKISGFPWWPGRVTAITVSENDLGIVYAYVAHVAWFASKTSSNISCSDLYPFVEHFASRFNRRKKGPYKNAIRLAKMAVLCRSSASAASTLPEASAVVSTVREHAATESVVTAMANRVVDARSRQVEAT